MESASGMKMESGPKDEIGHLVTSRKIGPNGFTNPKILRGNRKLLKDFMNCESDPLINGDPDCPIIKIIPPPPLHTVLLGPVNHIFKEFEKRYPKILERVSKSRALLK